MTYRTPRFSVAILGLALWMASSCSNTNLAGLAKKEEADDKAEEAKSSDTEKTNGLQRDGGESDIPTWINASHLTCSWDMAGDSDDPGVLCAVTHGDGSFPKPNAEFPVVWSAVHDQDGEETLPIEVNASGERIEALFHFPKGRLAAQIIRWSLNEAGFVPREESLRKILPGLGVDSDLEKCLGEGGSARACIEQAGPDAVDTKDATVPAAPGKKAFAFTGSDQAFTVPAGVQSITVKAWGGGGGRGMDLGTKSGMGGGGGYVAAKVSVTPGETLTIIVGGAGKAPAAGGGSGGGRSAIRRGASEILTAGGGGGGGSGFAGPLAGDTSGYAGLAGGVNAAHDQAKSGGNGLAKEAGAAGCQGSLCGKAGAQYLGGAGYCDGGTASYGGGGAGGVAAINPCGGGGGGGYFGGGGGGQSYGGGGGSSLVPQGGSSQAGQGTQPGNAQDAERSGAGEGAGDKEATAGKVSLEW